MTFDLDKAMADAEKEISKDSKLISLQVDNTGEASKQVCEEVMKIIINAQKKDSEGKIIPKDSEVLIATCILLQKGATSPKTASATKVPFGDAEVSVDMIKKACNNQKITTRQFARGLKNTIIKIMEDLGEFAPDGNLAKTYRLNNPTANLQKSDSIWISDFQTYNSQCPSEIRNWLITNYRDRFRTK